MRHTLTGVRRGCLGVAMLGSLVTVGVAVETYTDPFIVLLAALSCVVLSVPIVGSAALRSAPRNPVSWILLSAGTSISLALAGVVYARAAYVHGQDLPAPSVAAWLDGWPWVPAIVLVPTIGVLLFPDGRVPGKPWRILLAVELAVVAMLMAWALFETYALDYPARENLTALPGTAGEFATGMGAAILLVFPLSLTSTIAFERRRRRSTSSERRVLDSVRLPVWLMVLSWFGCVVIGAAGGDTLAALPAETVGMAALGIACWVAIRRHALFDARLAIRRGLVYSALTLLIMAVYVAAASLLTEAGVSHLATPVALALGVVLALPLRDRLQRLANRLVFGVGEDPYAALMRIGEQLETSAAGEEPLTNAASALHETLGAAHVSIVLGGEVMAEAGTADEGEPYEVPLLHAGERIGSIVLTLRPDQEPLTADRRQLLVGIARQVATATRAAALTRALTSSRERLIAATEEERRRLRRDLHDGLGPTLSGAVLGIARAKALLGPDPEAAAHQLDTSSAQVRDAVADVRRLVYGLRPPALDELGLIAALDEQARSLGPIVVVGPDHPIELSAAVEVAAYRIAMEAMTNAVRHARAESVTVDVRVNGSLELEIADDGIGLPRAFRAGVGITSMRERAAELGGSCVFENRTPTGTLVRATVPLAQS